MVHDYDTKMDVRQGGFVGGAADTMAGIADSGYSCKDKDAGRTCVLCAEAGREGWQVVQLPQVSYDDGT